VSNIPVGAKPSSSIRKNELGFTLIEILIALAISGIVLTAIYNLYISQSRTYTVQEQVSEMQQNARVAMDIVSRHIRMAGFGQPSWTTINGASITYIGVQVTDGGTGPDTLEIVGCIDSPPGTLSAAAAASATSISLQSGEGSSFNTSTKSDIFIGDLENAKVTGAGDTLTIDTDPATGGNQGLANAYAAGTNVYLVKRVKYALSGTDLTRDENAGGGADAVAIDIEDFQVSFTDPTVNVSITARTENPDSYYTGDGYRRMILTSNIIARNLE